MFLIYYTEYHQKQILDYFLNRMICMHFCLNNSTWPKSRTFIFVSHEPGKVTNLLKNTNV